MSLSRKKSSIVVDNRQKYSRSKSFFHHHPKSKIILNRSSSLRNLWEIHRSSKGQIYYYNVLTDQSQWEKPSNNQLFSMISNKSFISKRTKNDKKKSYSKNNFDRRKIVKTNFHHSDRRKSLDEITLSTPISPPSNEKIPLDLVDPIPTTSNSRINTSFLSTIKQSMTRQINEDLSSTVNLSSLNRNQTTNNTILQLDHSINFDSNRMQYDPVEFIEHLLNWPSTQIEREIIRLSNEQRRHLTYQLVSLRTDLCCIRSKLKENRFHLLKHHYLLMNQDDLLEKLL